jgi:hypothetical protein
MRRGRAALVARRRKVRRCPERIARAEGARATKKPPRVERDGASFVVLTNNVHLR